MRSFEGFRESHSIRMQRSTLNIEVNAQCALLLFYRTRLGGNFESPRAARLPLVRLVRIICLEIGGLFRQLGKNRRQVDK